MVEASVTFRLATLLDETSARCASYRELQPLAQTLTAVGQQLRRPMRVAIIGNIKAGKSTLMNALIGEDVVPTGLIENTFNVCWLTHGEQPELTVFYKDPGRAPEKHPLNELTAVASHGGDLTRLLTISHLEIRHPAPMLAHFDLIDTPGLASAHEIDSEKTRVFLDVHGDDLDRTTGTLAAGADAVLFAFKRSLPRSGLDLVRLFQGPALARLSPINAIGVLTHADHYADDQHDPLDRASAIIERLQREHAELRRFYAVRPVSGLLAFGARQITPDVYADIAALAAAPRFDIYALDARSLIDASPEELPLDGGRRKALLDLLGDYGLRLSVRLIREKGVVDEAALSSTLLARSGIEELYTLLSRHFGNRAELVKAQRALELTQTARARINTQSDEARQIVADFANRLERLELFEHAFLELRVLRWYYDGRLNLSDDEVKQLEEVTGEHGNDISARLGLLPDATPEQQRRRTIERIQAWRRRASDFGPSPETLTATATLARSYERLLHHLKQG